MQPAYRHQTKEDVYEGPQHDDEVENIPRVTKIILWQTHTFVSEWTEDAC